MLFEPAIELLSEFFLMHTPRFGCRAVHCSVMVMVTVTVMVTVGLGGYTALVYALGVY